MKNVIKQFQSLFSNKAQKEKENAERVRKEQEEKEKAERIRRDAELVRNEQAKKEVSMNEKVVKYPKFIFLYTTLHRNNIDDNFLLRNFANFMKVHYSLDSVQEGFDLFKKLRGEGLDFSTIGGVPQNDVFTGTLLDIFANRMIFWG